MKTMQKFENIRKKCTEEVLASSLYQELSQSGMKPKKIFKYFWKSSQEALGEAEISSANVLDVIEASFQISFLLLPEKIFTDIPWEWQNLDIKESFNKKVFFHTVLSSTRVSNIEIFDEQGKTLASISDIKWGNPTKPKIEESEDTHEFIKQVMAMPKKQRVPLVKNHLLQGLGKLMEIEPTQIDPKKNFMYMGMDSLLALEMLEQLSKDLAVKIPITTLSENPTIEHLAKYIVDYVLEGKSSLPSKESVLDKQQNQEVLGKLGNIAVVQKNFCSSLTFEIVEE